MAGVDRYVEGLAVRVGAGVAPGQDVVVLAWDVEHAPIARAVAEEAYLAGARFVSVVYWDQHVKRSRLRHAPAESLGFVPRWFDAIMARVRRAARGDRRGVGEPGSGPARQHGSGAPEPRPHVPDAGHGGRDRARRRGLDGRAGPLPRRRERDVRRAGLDRRAALLDEHGFEAVRFLGGGTDLTVGLAAGTRWTSASATTSWGAPMVVNMPTEEVFTTPDFRRVDGVVRATRTFHLTSGGRVEDLELRFAGGRLTGVEATAGAELVRKQTSADAGASRLGEVALVDGSSPVGKTGRVFGDVLFDENATSHIAWGGAYTFTVRDLPDDEAEHEALGVNHSLVHQDMMVGGPEVDVLGVGAGGDEVPIIADDAWVLS